jgi:4-hydroxy-4-methyl-2-oxoglutarate aldolase
VELAPEVLEGLKRYDTCTLANAIERFQVRLRNAGYTGPGLKCFTGDFQPVAGYAVTSRVRTADPPMSGGRYYERTEWWSAIEAIPAPRIAIIEDLDAKAGAGSVAGEVHCAILQRFGCVGLATNGAVRDISAVRGLGFAAFAHHLSVGHAYTHAVDFGAPVNIFGLTIHSGDLLCGDCHGLLSIPKDIAAQIPAVAEEIRQHDRKVIDLCQSPDFSIEKLRRLI